MSSRALWITRINAALRPLGMSYSKFMGGLKKADIAIDRKALADLAIFTPNVFSHLTDLTRPLVEGEELMWGETGSRRSLPSHPLPH